MKSIVALGLTMLAMVGCSSSPSEEDGAIKPGSGVALNPSGKPQSAADSDYADQMKAMGNTMNRQRDADAAAMAAAKARTGGK